MQSENVTRSAISKSLTDEAGRGNVDGVKTVLAQAEAEGFLREELLRAGIRTASRRNKATTLRTIIDKAKDANLLGDDGNTLRLGLQDAAKLGNEAAAVELLRAGAKTDLSGSDGSTALYWACTQPTTPGHLATVKILLSKEFEHCPADTEWQDKDGLTALVSAATKGHDMVVALLLQHGANADARDKTGKSVLHIVASATASARVRWNDATAQAILGARIDVDAKDKQGRTALHWACSTRKLDVVKQLLRIRHSSHADPNSRTSRGKTALHLACGAGPVNAEIVEALISAGADPGAVSDGGYTCLHIASSVQGGAEVIDRLLQASPTLLNSTTSTGQTALHIASESGELATVERLLHHPECKVHAVDAYDCSALLRGAAAGHTDIVQKLAPSNNIQRLSQYAVDACKGFDATVVDVRMKSEHKVLVQKRPVHEVLYDKNDDGTSLVTTSVHKLKHPADFRWIHLPANNMAWTKALLTKAFIEEGATDVEAYRAMEKVWRQQHRGPKHPFMRSLCDRAARRTGAETPSFPVFDRPRADYASSPERLSRFAGRLPPQVESTKSSGTRTPRSHKENKGNEDKGNDDSGSSPASNTVLKPKQGNRFRNRQRKPEALVPTPLEDSNTVSGATPPAARAASFPISDVSVESHETKDSGSNIAYFMPYLHYETDRGRRQMHEAAKTHQSGLHPGYHTPSCADEALVYAYLGSTTGLHLRRTLDQFWLHGVETDTRDEDQVVGRWCKLKNIEERIFMVDQLWLFVLGPRLVVTAFPQRWRQPKRDDPLDLVEGIIQDLSQPSSVTSVYDFVSLITARASGAFDRHISHPDWKFMDIFEMSIGNIADQETKLYSYFYEASAAVHAWLKDPLAAKDTIPHTLSSTSRRYPAVIDKFLDIGKETSLLQEVKDIRDELAMLSMVLNQQKAQLPLLSEALSADFNTSRTRPLRELRRKFDDQKKLVSTHLAEIKRMTDLAEVIETSLLNLLDLKQKQANAFEARFARDQAAGTVRQGQIIMVFTMVTIIFLPMSFVATFFDIPIAEYPTDGSGALRLSYVSKYTFGVGLAISVALILIAFSLNPLTEIAQRVKGKRESGAEHGESISDGQRKQSSEKTFYSVGRFSHDIRKSMEAPSVREVSASPAASMAQRRRRGSNILPV